MKLHGPHCRGEVTAARLSCQVWFDVSERELETVSRTATKLGYVCNVPALVHT